LIFDLFWSDVEGIVFCFGYCGMISGRTVEKQRQNRDI